MKSTATICALVLSLAFTAQSQAESSPAATLDAFYKAGAGANQPAFIAQLAEDAVLLGVNGDTRLQGQSLRDYVSKDLAREQFSDGNIWTYYSRGREIRLSADGAVAWFDESLQHEKLGPGRASGVLIANGGDWKIAQYNLTAPRPVVAVASPTGAPEAAPGTQPATPAQQPECKQLRHKTNKKSTC
jgi:SnoaL-like domain